MFNKLKPYVGNIALALASLVIIIIIVLNVFNSTTTETGIVTIQFEDLNGEVIAERNIMFVEDETMMNILERSFAMNYEYSASFGVFLKTIGPLDARYTENVYIGIYIDGAYSNVGISQIVPKDGMIITFSLIDWTLE